MPNPQTYGSLVPFGKMAITAAGTTTPLSVNCGPLGGEIQGADYTRPAVPGARVHQITLQSISTNSGILYLLPRGKTASANPESVIAIIGIGGGITIPSGIMLTDAMLPENFVLDTDASSGTQYCYGFGVIG